MAHVTIPSQLKKARCRWRWGLGWKGYIPLPLQGVNQRNNRFDDISCHHVWGLESGRAHAQDARGCLNGICLHSLRQDGINLFGQGLPAQLKHSRCRTCLGRRELLHCSLQLRVKITPAKCLPMLFIAIEHPQKIQDSSGFFLEGKNVSEEVRKENLHKAHLQLDDLN